MIHNYFLTNIVFAHWTVKGHTHLQFCRTVQKQPEIPGQSGVAISCGVSWALVGLYPPSFKGKLLPWTGAISKHKGPEGYVNEGDFPPADQTGWLKGLCSKWVGASSSVNSLFFPPAFHRLFPERVSFSWFSRATKDFLLQTGKGSFLPFSR